MHFIFLLLLFLQSTFVRAHSNVGGQDHYKSFKELAAHNEIGRDYDILISQAPSNILVMAFHGGLIEPGTTELGLEVAKNKFNFYSFIGKKNSDVHEPSFTSADLHLTSARFDEPKLLEMVLNAQDCLSLHGFGGEEADFCVGGGNTQLRKEITDKLAAEIPAYKSCELCCPPFNGVSLKNPVNRCLNQGVQIEMSPAVRKRILTDLDFRRSVGKVLVDTLH